MARIVLATVNANYIHAAFGLRYLRANLGEYRSHSAILEFTLKARPMDVVEALLEQSPRIIGLGVYIWNVEFCAQVCTMLKTLAPEVKLILGGPEVSHELDGQPWTQHADYIVQGEGEIAFYEIVDKIMRGRPSLTRVHQRAAPDFRDLCLPYEEYTDRDIRQRVIYVEASRGCPFRCAFCLSALDRGVRPVESEAFFAALQRLLDRGVERFKFVDRTFNLSIEKSGAILDFFLERYREGLFLHFEMIPDRLPEALKAKLALFPPAAIQLEVGIQSLNPAVNAHIDRRQRLDRAKQNMLDLRERTGVHIHADLIIGLPGEPWSSFLDGLDELLTWKPQEIQLGVLKRLRGAPLSQRAEAFDLRFDAHAPYEVLSTSELSFAQLQAARRMAHLWDRVVNQGHFPQTLQEGLWRPGVASCSRAFEDLSRWMMRAHGRVHAWSLHRLALHLGQYLCLEQGLHPRDVSRLLGQDLERQGHQVPARIAAGDFALEREVDHGPIQRAPSGPPKRQLRHLAAHQRPD